MTEASKVGSGGFYFPTVYTKDQAAVIDKLEEGEIDYADLTAWYFPDEFMCFALEFGLFKFVDQTYPNPRQKNEVPIWFLISCQFLLHIYQTGKYDHLRYLLNAGSILTRFGFNVGKRVAGFNQKNNKERVNVVDSDTVRKFFKDTDPQEIRRWYTLDLQQWFVKKKAFDKNGIFILDQSHLVVPNNPKYKDAVKLPVDHHGQWCSNLGGLTAEQKQGLVYHPCYTLSTLLNVGFDSNMFHVASYEFGAGNEDEVTHAEKLIPLFCRKYPGVMKELIIDRGYISGTFINNIKKNHGVDVIIPLRKDMDLYIDAISLATSKDQWKKIDEDLTEIAGELTKVETYTTLVTDMDLWPGLTYKQHVAVSKFVSTAVSTLESKNAYGCIVSTKKHISAETIINIYKMRVRVEERFRQFKHDWYITEFPSTSPSLMESHVCFTLLTYSLMQMYFRRNDLQKQTHKFMSTFRRSERTGKEAVLVYADTNYAVIDLDDCMIKVAGMRQTPREKLTVIMEAQKKERLKREAAAMADDE